MRRAAIQTICTARSASLKRSCLGRRRVSEASYGLLGLRQVSSFSRDNAQHRVLHSSMYLRNFSVALFSTLVASGAWYAYKDTDTKQVLNRQDSPSAAYSTATRPHPNSPFREGATESTRQAVTLDDNQVISSNIAGQGPLSKETDDHGKKRLEMLTPEEATAKLRTNEESYLVSRGHGVVRYDVVQIPSNDPIEDDHAEKIIEVPSTLVPTEDGKSSNDWMFWGVFDGHSGWTTSAKLRQVLISFVARELNTTYKSSIDKSSTNLPAPSAIDAAIKQGFLRLDNEIVHESVSKVMKANSRRVAAELLAPALSGSCALLSFYDSQSKLLRVACTGDVRAVLGRRGPDGKWMAIPLSEDQTGDTPSEVERMRKEHPDEPHVIAHGRVLGGLQPTRAFGDAVYKWSRETQEKLKASFFGRTPNAHLRSPPYVTAEPVVTTTKIEPQNGDFLVMATDGLWEMLTNEEAIGLVGRWLDLQAPEFLKEQMHVQPRSTYSWNPLNWFSSPTARQTPLSVAKSGEQVDAHGQRLPIRQQQWSVNPNDNRFVVEDKNVATHLVRNALGGKDRDMLCALLTLPSPFSRRYRDDLTVEVVFFGEGSNNGNISVNHEASATRMDGQPKAKL